MKISISRRIKRAMVGLTLITCLVFISINFVLIYITEDSVFIKTLRSENQQFQRLSESDRQDWQPLNRHMKLYTKKSDLPNELQNLFSDKWGVYEYFNDGIAKFVLYEKFDNESNPYFITYDVSELLAVRSARANLLITVLIVSLMVMLIALIAAHFLANKVLNPLKKLTAEIENSDEEFPADFAPTFYGDEVGVLAQKLEEAVLQVQSSARREYEFNRGISHELRTPIQVAINSVELLELQNQNTSSDHSKVISRLHRSISKMQQLTEVFLWLSSTQEKTSNQVHLIDCIEKVRDEYKELFPKHEIVIQSIPETEIVLNLPAEAVAVVIDNVFRNAVQHGSSNSILCTITEQSILIKNEVNKEEALNYSSSGYGIGLTIVERLCEKLDWKIEIPNVTDNHYLIKILINRH